MTGKGIFSEKQEEKSFYCAKEIRNKEQIIVE
jgi:hypothetical protein